MNTHAFDPESRLLDSVDLRYYSDAVVSSFKRYMRKSTEYRRLNIDYYLPDGLDDTILKELKKIPANQLTRALLDELGVKIAKRYVLKKDIWRYGGTIAATILIGLGGKSCAESEAVRRIAVQEKITAKQAECDRILQASCPLAYDNLYMQVRPLVQGEVPQSGTSMNVLYIKRNSQGICEVLDNQVHVTRRFKEGKNYVTRTVGSEKLLDPILPYSPPMQKCITDWKG